MSNFDPSIILKSPSLVLHSSSSLKPQTIEKKVLEYLISFLNLPLYLKALCHPNGVCGSQYELSKVSE